LITTPGSGKSIFAAQKKLIRTMSEDSHRFLYCRKVARTIRDSTFQSFRQIISDWKLNAYFKLNKSEMDITYLPNGNSLISSGLDDVEKLKSIAGITGVWIEEATELDDDDFKQINLRLRGETKNYKQIIYTFNPIDDGHYINRKFFLKNINAE